MVIIIIKIIRIIIIYVRRYVDTNKNNKEIAGTNLCKYIIMESEKIICTLIVVLRSNNYIITFYRSTGQWLLGDFSRTSSLYSQL